MTEKIEEAVLETGEYSVAVASVISTGSSSSSSTITDEGVLPDVGDTDTGNEGNTSECEEDGVYEEPSGGSTGNNSSASSIMSSCLETCIEEDENAEAQPETPVSTVPGSSVADPVDAYSGAHTIKNNVLSLFGGQNISLNVSYNSSKLLRGVFGVGWYHNYEKRISLYGSGYRVYDNPGTYCLYTACSCSNVYTTESSTKHGYTPSDAAQDLVLSEGITLINSNDNIIESKKSYHYREK